jgi:1,4-dihydroxy-6-naphthoate synthase
MSRKVRLGISTCPNDTFAFHALMHGKVDLRGVDFQIELLDIQTLNERLFESSFDVAKASFHAAILLADHYVVLPSGSALGFGVGPLLLAAEDSHLPLNRNQLTLCPGKHTTAALLFEMFFPNTTRVEHTMFSEIMPRLRNKSADFGVCIHEGRFTWRQEGLSLVEDLGTRWEQETHSPLPLGGIIASRSLDPKLIEDIQSVIQDSIRFALANKQDTLPTMRQYAQEFNDTVLMQHVDLYVNEWTVDLGAVGSQALRQLQNHALAAGVCSNTKRLLEVFCAG